MEMDAQIERVSVVDCRVGQAGDLRISKQSGRIGCLRQPSQLQSAG